MKKLIFAAFVFAASATGAFAAETPSDKVLSVDHISFAGVQYDLPTTQKADGTVCVSYVAETHQENGKSVAKVAQHCAGEGDRRVVLPSMARETKSETALKR